MKEIMNMKLKTLILAIALILGISTNISAQPTPEK